MRRSALCSLLAAFVFASCPGFASAVIVIGPPPPPVAQYSSVAFIPGIEGSRLLKPSLLNFGDPDRLWEPLLTSNTKNLFLDSNGQSIDSSIYVGGIIDQAVAPVIGPKIYKSFADQMDSLANDQHAIKEWKALSYDWRLAADTVVDNGVDRNYIPYYNGVPGINNIDHMVDDIETLASSSYTHKVTIIAHSMGGLVAKVLIDRLAAKGEAGLIDKLILVAVPELGTPQAIGTLLHGSGGGIGKFGVNFLLLDSTARGLAANAPGAYQLLPSAAYFSKVADPVVEFDPSIDPISNLRTSYGNTIADPAKLTNFLTAATDHRAAPGAFDLVTPLVANASILAKVSTLHSQLDMMAIPSNIQVTQIAGWGLNTIRGVKYVAKTDTSCGTNGVCGPVSFLDNQPIFVEDGDGTVVTPSATAVSALSYYFDLRTYNQVNDEGHDHKDIFEAQPILDFVKNVITNNSTIPTFFSTTKPAPGQARKSIRLSGHSPISIDLYDSQGRHTGLIPNPNTASDLQLYEANIPNSYYLPFGEGKYAGYDESIPTQVKIQGTGTGTFTLNTEEVVGGTPKTAAVFADVPVLPTTLATVSFDGSDNPTLSVDTNGDGTIDQALKPKQDFDPIAYLQAMRKAVLGFHLPKGAEKELLAKIDDMIKKIQKGKIASVVKKIQSYLRGVQKDNHDRDEREHHREREEKHRKNLDSMDVKTIVDMLNTLLDNLK